MRQGRRLEKGLLMGTIVIEHVPVAELPAEWRAKLPALADATVTVRIETEEVQATAPAEAFVTDDPAFGIWRDRADMADVEAYVSGLRTPRFRRDGSRDKP